MPDRAPRGLRHMIHTAGAMPQSLNAPTMDRPAGCLVQGFSRCPAAPLHRLATALCLSRRTRAPLASPGTRAPPPGASHARAGTFQTRSARISTVSLLRYPAVVPEIREYWRPHRAQAWSATKHTKKPRRRKQRAPGLHQQTMSAVAVVSAPSATPQGGHDHRRWGMLHCATEKGRAPQT